MPHHTGAISEDTDSPQNGPDSPALVPTVLTLPSNCYCYRKFRHFVHLSSLSQMLSFGFHHYCDPGVTELNLRV